MHRWQLIGRTCESPVVQTSTAEVETPDGVADAYLARPDERPRPGVLFLMDAYGLRPTIEEMVERIASDGYVVLAPNVLYRGGRAVTLPSSFDELRPMIQQLTPERIATDGRAYLDALTDVAAPGPPAITGYCMGGRVGWRIAAAYPDRVAALAGFHVGGLVSDDPDSPHRSAGELRAEVYLGFADQDRSMTAEQIAALERALDKAGVRYRAEVYGGAQHGDTMADLPVYDEAASERHFRELQELLGRRLSPREAK
jgi:carboxymethylenebutenolidase